MQNESSSRIAMAEVRRVAVITHGRPETIGAALKDLQALAVERGVEVLLPHEEAEKHGVASPDGDVEGADLAVVLGGDGTMLRALRRFLGTGVPVLGVNFGRVGFLASFGADSLEEGLGRAFSGDYRVVELPALEGDARGGRWAAVNDVVVTSSSLGRMIELGWAVGHRGAARLEIGTQWAHMRHNLRAPGRYLPKPPPTQGRAREQNNERRPSVRADRHPGRLGVASRPCSGASGSRTSS